MSSEHSQEESSDLVGYQISIKRAFLLPPSFVIWRKKSISFPLYASGREHKNPSPLCIHLSYIFNLVVNLNEVWFRDGEFKDTVLHDSWKQAARMRKKFLINSCIVGKHKLWAQLLLFNRESTQERALKSEIYRKPSSNEKWSNTNNEIKEFCNV